EVEVLALWIQRRAIETAELRLPRRAAVAAEAFGACSREGTHTAAVRVEVTNALVPGVGQEQFPIGKGGQTVHAIELRLPAQAAVAGKTFRSSPRDDVKQTVRAHFPDALTARHLDEKQVAPAVEIHAERRRQLRFDGGRVIFLGAAARHKHEVICPDNEREKNGTDGNKVKGVHERCLGSSKSSRARRLHQPARPRRWPRGGRWQSQSPWSIPLPEPFCFRFVSS